MVRRDNMDHLYMVFFRCACFVDKKLFRPHDRHFLYCLQSYSGRAKPIDSSAGGGAEYEMRQGAAKINSKVRLNPAISDFPTTWEWFCPYFLSGILFLDCKVCVSTKELYDRKISAMESWYVSCDPNFFARWTIDVAGFVCNSLASLYRGQFCQLRYPNSAIKDRFTE